MSLAGCTTDFNSRPRVGGDTCPCKRNTWNRHFNSRPRVGGDHFFGSPPVSTLISIPAPAWGATLVDQFGLINPIFQFPPPRGGRQGTEYWDWSLPISIPAPAWGATAKIDKKACGFCCKFTKFALRLFKKQEDFYWKSSFCPKRRTFFLTFPAPIARRLVYGWHRRRKTRGYRSKGSPDWIGAVFPSAWILFL